MVEICGSGNVVVIVVVIFSAADFGAARMLHKQSFSKSFCGKCCVS